MKFTYSSYIKAKDITALGCWVLLYGPEQHLKREALARLRTEAMAGEGESAEATWETLDGASATARDLLSRAQTGALFGGARGIAVLQAEKIDAEEQETLARSIAPLSPGVMVILVTGEPRDRREKGLKARLLRVLEDQKNRHCLAIDCPELRKEEATQWAISYAASLGKRLEPAAATKLTGQRIGASLGELASELDKLASYAGEAETITAAAVEAVTPRLLEEDVFALVDAVAAQSAGQAVSLLRSLLRDRREAPERLLALLASALREVWQVKLLIERGWRRGAEADEQTRALLPTDPRKNVLGALTGRRAFLLERRARHARAFSWPRLTRAMLALHSCDMAVKGASDRTKLEDKEVALELLVVQLCTDLAMPLLDGAG